MNTPTTGPSKDDCLSTQSHGMHRLLALLLMSIMGPTVAVADVPCRLLTSLYGPIAASKAKFRRQTQLLSRMAFLRCATASSGEMCQVGGWNSCGERPFSIRAPTTLLELVACADKHTYMHACYSDEQGLRAVCQRSLLRMLHDLALQV